MSSVARSTRAMVFFWVVDETMGNKKRCSEERERERESGWLEVN
jgi:hypothetical protein